MDLLTEQGNKASSRWSVKNKKEIVVIGMLNNGLVALKLAEGWWQIGV